MLLAGVRWKTLVTITPRTFRRHLGVHYSGAETPDSSLKNLRVYSATPDTPPQAVLPPPGPRKYWSRRELAHWLAQELASETPTIVGIGAGALWCRGMDTRGATPVVRSENP